MKSIILIGMPSSGKTYVGEALAKSLQRPFIDLDDVFIERVQRTPQEVVKQDGHELFRRLETECLASVADIQDAVISTGGGIVTEERNRPYLEKNIIIYVKRELDDLDVEGRPLAKGLTAAALFAERRSLYESWSHYEVENHDAEQAVADIRRLLNL